MGKYGVSFNLVVIAVVISTFLPASLVYTPAQAALVHSQMVTEDGAVLSPRDIDEIKVKRALENKLVQQRLESTGLTKVEVLEKMERMSDEEVHQIASLSDKVPSGGDSAVGFVAGVLVIVILVLVILYLVKRV